jgi:hypothetical protein
MISKHLRNPAPRARDAFSAKRAPARRPRVRRLAVIRTDESGFSLGTPRDVAQTRFRMRGPRELHAGQILTAPSLSSVHPGL